MGVIALYITPYLVAFLGAGVSMDKAREESSGDFVCELMFPSADPL